MSKNLDTLASAIASGRVRVPEPIPGFSRAEEEKLARERYEEATRLAPAAVDELHEAFKRPVFVWSVLTTKQLRVVSAALFRIVMHHRDW
jgi:hypothetical protein